MKSPQVYEGTALRFPVSPSDDRFAPCRDCFTGYLASHLRSWRAALSRGRLPSTPIGHIGRQGWAH